MNKYIIALATLNLVVFLAGRNHHDRPPPPQPRPNPPRWVVHEQELPRKLWAVKRVE